MSREDFENVVVPAMNDFVLEYLSNPMLNNEETMVNALESLRDQMVNELVVYQRELNNKL